MIHPEAALWYWSAITLVLMATYVWSGNGKA
jgi:hypothetical protein